MGAQTGLNFNFMAGPGALVCLYQPFVDLRTGLCTGFEVLSRWQNEKLELLSPAQFVPALERAGAIAPFTRRLLAQVFADAKVLSPDCNLAVNVSPLQLQNSLLCNDLRYFADQYDFDLRRLTIELTESAIIENLDQARTVLHRLKDLGCKLALDDFGTGHSSLTLLHSMPFDELKIDQTFVRDMVTRKDSRKIVAAVVGLGSSLGLMTVAEGVEEQRQGEMLARMGCDWGQGWVYSKPLPRDAARDFLKTVHRPDAHETPPVHDAAELCLEALPADRYAQLRAIYHGAPVGLCFMDRELRVVSLNRYLADLNGVPLEAHLGRRIAEVMPAVYEKVGAWLLRALEGESLRDVEYELRPSPDAPIQTRLVSYQPAIDEAGEVVGVSISVVDMTGRRQAERRLQAIIDALPMGIVIADAPDGRVVSRNPAALRILEQDPLEFENVASYSNRIDYFHAGRKLNSNEFPLARALAFGAVTEGMEVFCQLNADRGKWLLLSGAPVRDQEGKIIGAVVAIQPRCHCVEAVSEVDALAIANAIGPSLSHAHAA